MMTPLFQGVTNTGRCSEQRKEQRFTSAEADSLCHAEHLSAAHNRRCPSFPCCNSAPPNTYATTWLASSTAGPKSGPASLGNRQLCAADESAPESSLEVPGRVRRRSRVMSASMAPSRPCTACSTLSIWTVDRVSGPHPLGPPIVSSVSPTCSTCKHPALLTSQAAGDKRLPVIMRQQCSVSDGNVRCTPVGAELGHQWLQSVK